MAKIPFSIKYRPQIESGEYKVETRDGRSARIICWDKNNVNYPIAALVTMGNREYFYDYTRKGELHVSEEGIYDLFIVTPEPEMSEMEIRLLSWLSDDTSGEIPMERMKHIVKARAAELLALAREELFANDTVLKEYAEEARKQGKAEALKDLPRWKKATGKERFNERMIVLAGDNDLYCTNYAEEGEYYLPFPILEKLPKEDERHE